MRFSRQLLYTVFPLTMLFSAVRGTYAQSYVHAPLYRVSGQGVSGIPKWSGLPTEANGTTSVLSESGDAAAVGGDEEGMRVDGAPGTQVLHWFISFYRPHVTFGYDLLLEPIAGTTKIRCTFSKMTEFEHSLRNMSSQLVPLPEPLTPIEIEDGGTLSISFLPEGDPKQVFTQQVQVKLLKVGVPVARSRKS